MREEINVGLTAMVALWFTWREVIPRIWSMKAGNANGRAGSQTVDFWRIEFAKSQREAMEQALVPKFDQQIAIFEEIRAHMVKTNEALAVLLASDVRRRGR